LAKVTAKIRQDVTVSSITAAQYTGDVKAVYEVAYAVALGVYDTGGKSYRAGNSVTSSAVSASRRAGATISYTASVTHSYVTAANTAATTLVTNPAALISGVATANTALSKSVAAPLASDFTVKVGTPAVGTKTLASGSGRMSHDAALAIFAMAFVVALGEAGEGR